MAKKIEIIDNALIVTDTISTKIEISEPAKDYWYKESELQIGRIILYDANGLKGDEQVTQPIINLSDAVDGSLVAFTESTFRDFCTSNLGKSSPESGAISENQVLINQDSAQSVLSGSLDSTKEYFIDGIVDLTGLGVSFEVPSGGLNIRGFNFDVSQLICSGDNYTMFTSPVGGSGNVLGMDYGLTTNGTNSKVYDLKPVDTGRAFEFSRINYNDCTSLGVIDGYRQGLESGTGRFGGTPNLVLEGNWLGGYRVTTSIVRGLDVGFTGSLFEKGASFTMQSRFLSDINLDLSASSSFFDFEATNFPNPSTIQLDGCIITRDGLSDPEDLNITPNITNVELPCSWVNNQGIKNTFVGGKMSIILEATTVIANTNDYVDLNGTYLTSDLQHFEEDGSGRLKHLGNNPREFRVFFDGIIDGGSNDVLILKLVKWDDTISSFEDIGIQVRQVNALVGSRDVAFFNYVTTVELDKDDYIKWQIRNTSSTTNLVYELDGSWVVEAR